MADDTSKLSPGVTKRTQITSILSQCCRVVKGYNSKCVIKLVPKEQKSNVYFYLVHTDIRKLPWENINYWII